jgi:hypothetical protein
MEGKRPGGLTALAVFNFIFAAFSLLGAVTLLAMPALLELAAQSAGESASQMNDQQRAQIEAMTEMGGTLPLMLTAAGSALVGALLIASGVGYLKQKKFLGRTLGNVYAVFSLVTSIPIALFMPVALGGGFNLLSILGLLYPALTLLLLNTVFKEDFVN